VPGGVLGEELGLADDRNAPVLDRVAALQRRQPDRRRGARVDHPVLRPKLRAAAIAEGVVVGGSSAAPILHRTSTHADADARPEDRSLGRNVVRTRADDVIDCGDIVSLRCPFVRTRCALVPLR
jgi:hypothetical protein